MIKYFIYNSQILRLVHAVMPDKSDFYIIMSTDAEKHYLIFDRMHNQFPGTICSCHVNHKNYNIEVDFFRRPLN